MTSRPGDEMTQEQIRRRRERDRVNKARARARAAGQDPDEIPSLLPGFRRVVLPVSRAAQGWQDQAACRGEPPEWFDAETDQNAAKALTVCARCEVCRECLAAAIADHAVSGVWGGIDLSAAERRAVS